MGLISRVSSRTYRERSPKIQDEPILLFDTLSPKLDSAPTPSPGPTPTPGPTDSTTPGKDPPPNPSQILIPPWSTPTKPTPEKEKPSFLSFKRTGNWLINNILGLTDLRLG